MKLYDCCMYFDEDLMLDLRLNILKATWFITAQKKKELKKLEDRFEKWLEKQEGVA